MTPEANRTMMRTMTRTTTTMTTTSLTFFRQKETFTFWDVCLKTLA